MDDGPQGQRNDIICSYGIANNTNNEVLLNEIEKPRAEHTYIRCESAGKFRWWYATLRQTIDNDYRHTFTQAYCDVYLESKIASR